MIDLPPIPRPGSLKEAILALTAQGHSAGEIANRLRITQRTVAYHRKKIDNRKDKSK